MNKEDILKMEAGRELDELIAEKVMGYNVYHYDKDYEANCYYMLIDGEGDYSDIERKTEEEAWKDCPKFSTDISASYEMESRVFETGLADDYGFEIYLITGADEFNDRIHNINVFKIVHATPEQRCKAALLASLEVETCQKK